MLLPEFGSPSRQFFISKYLAKIPGNEVMLIGSRSTLGNVPPIKGLYRSTKEGNLETVTLNGAKIKLGFNLKRLWSWLVFEVNIFKFRKKIKTFSPDLVIVSSLSILSFLSGVFLKKWLKIALVIEIRDIYPLTLLEVGNFSYRNPIILFLKWVEKTGYKNADLIVSTLPNAKEHVSTVLNRPFEFYWLPMGIDPDYYKTSRKNIQIHEWPQKESGQFIVGYAGTLGKANAMDVVFEAARVLNSSHPHIKFIFIGDGPLKSLFQDRYKNLTNITFVPPVPKDHLPALLDRADVLVNSWLDKPIYKYGISPNKWMDYMYAAKPVLIPYSGYRCIIDEAKCGIFLPAENVGSLVESILHFSTMDKLELIKMGENGKKYLFKNLTYEALSYNFFQRLISIVGIKKTFDFKTSSA